MLSAEKRRWLIAGVGLMLLIAGGIGLWAYKESQRPRPAGAKQTRDDPVEVKQRFLSGIADKGKWEIVYFAHITEHRQNHWSATIKGQGKTWGLGYYPNSDTGFVSVRKGEEELQRMEFKNDNHPSLIADDEKLGSHLYQSLRLAVWEF